MKGLVTSLFLILFTSVLSLDAYAKTAMDQSLTYELMQSEEDPDADEEDSEEELKKDDYFDFADIRRIISRLLTSQFIDNQIFWKSNEGEIIAPPPRH